MFSLIKEHFYHSIILESNIKSICNLYDGERFICGLSNGKIQIINYYINKNKIFKKGDLFIHKENLNLKINILKLLDYNIEKMTHGLLLLNLVKNLLIIYKILWLIMVK